MVDLPHTVYNHLKEVFLPKLPVQFSVCKIRSTIIQGIALFLSAPFYSYKEQVLQALLVKLSVYQIYFTIIEGPAFPAPLVHTVNNQLRDVFLLRCLCRCQFVRYILQSSKR